MTKNDKVFLSVETPSVFREIEVPIDESDRSPDEAAAVAALVDLADARGTIVYVSHYRRG